MELKLDLSNPLVHALLQLYKHLPIFQVPRKSNP